MIYKLVLVDEDSTLISEFYLYKPDSVPTEEFLEENECFQIGGLLEDRDLMDKISNEILIHESNLDDGDVCVQCGEIVVDGSVFCSEHIELEAEGVDDEELDVK